MLDAVPAGQLEQRRRPAAPAKLPAVHVWQADAPMTELADPAAQGRHCPLVAPADPAAQAVQSVEPATVVVVPVPQSWQDDCPMLMPKVDVGQGEQELEPVVAEKVPAGQN